MQNVKATNSQRFIAYFIDMMIISLLTSLFAGLISTALKFDSSVADKLYSDLINEIVLYISDYTTTSASIGSIFTEYIKYAGVSMLISACVSLFLVIIYLVIIPMFWEKQTLGRLIMKIKVVDRDLDFVSKKRIILREILGTWLMYLVLPSSTILASVILASSTGRSLVDYIAKTDLVDARELGETVVSSLEPKDEEKQYDDYIDAKFKEYPLDDKPSESDEESERYRVF